MRFPAARPRGPSPRLTTDTKPAHRKTVPIETHTLNPQTQPTPQPVELDPAVKPRGVANGGRTPSLDSPRLDRGAQLPHSQQMQNWFTARRSQSSLTPSISKPNLHRTRRVGPRVQAAGSRKWRTQTQLATPRDLIAGPITLTHNKCKTGSPQDGPNPASHPQSANPTHTAPVELDPAVKPRGVARGEHTPSLDSPRLDRGAQLPLSQQIQSQPNARRSQSSLTPSISKPNPQPHPSSWTPRLSRGKSRGEGAPPKPQPPKTPAAPTYKAPSGVHH